MYLKTSDHINKPADVKNKESCSAIHTHMVSNYATGVRDDPFT